MRAPVAAGQVREEAPGLTYEVLDAGADRVKVELLDDDVGRTGLLFYPSRAEVESWKVLEEAGDAD